MNQGIYLDAVLDINMRPLFNGTPERVVEWLIQNSGDWLTQKGAEVCVGRTLEMKSIDDYLREYDASQK